MKQCLNCQSTKTYVSKQGYEQWNKGYCQKCYNRLFSNPKYNPKNREKWNPKRMYFKDKQIILKHEPRTHICSECGKQGVTHLHHTQYDESDPLKYTIELCVSCHAKESYKLGQLTGIMKKL